MVNPFEAPLKSFVPEIPAISRRAEFFELEKYMI
jgi:hypothetical protein